MLADLAREALLAEVTLDYKPGLVCQNSQGSHTDMDVSTFRQSIDALYPHFLLYEQIGQTSPLENLFSRLRNQGLLAEQSMFEATQGINTHKGANFILSLLIGSISYLNNHKQSLTKLKSVIMKISQQLNHDFNLLKNKHSISNGERLYLKYQIKGIRQEAMEGFPILFDYPFSQVSLDPESWYEFLIGSIFHLQDTTIIHRSGLEGLEWAQNRMKSLNPSLLIDKFDSINEEFVLRRISPGGSADFLSAAIFIALVHQKYKEVL